MKRYILDCRQMEREGQFWDLYVETIAVEGEAFFGRNLAAFWDAISAGGPGLPGPCEIELVNIDGLAKWRAGAFYNALVRMAADLSPGSPVKLIIPEQLPVKPFWRCW